MAIQQTMTFLYQPPSTFACLLLYSFLFILSTYLTYLLFSISLSLSLWYLLFWILKHVQNPHHLMDQTPHLHFPTSTTLWISKTCSLRWHTSRLPLSMPTTSFIFLCRVPSSSSKSRHTILWLLSSTIRLCPLLVSTLCQLTSSSSSQPHPPLVPFLLQVTTFSQLFSFSPFSSCFYLHDLAYSFSMLLLVTCLGSLLLYLYILMNN